MIIINNSPNSNLNKVKKKSKEEYLFELKIIANSVNVEILSNYVNSRTLLNVRCKKCHLEWDIRPTAIKGRRGRNWKGCPNCGKKVDDLVNSYRNAERIKEQTKLLNKIVEAKNVDILSEYKNAKTLLNLRCRSCGYNWSSIPENIKGSVNRAWSGCPKCNRGRKADSPNSLKKKFEKELRAKHNLTTKRIENLTKRLNGLKEIARKREIEIISDYFNVRTPLKLKCKKCFYEWLALPSTIKCKAPRIWSGCPKCRKKSNPLRTSHVSPEEKKKEINKINELLNKQNIKFLSKYVNNKTPLKLKCDNCKHTWFSQPRSILRRKKEICPNCKLFKRKEYFYKKSQKTALDRGGKLLSNDYVNSYTQLEWKCDICNYTWKSTYDSVVNKKSWCPNCSDMISERICRAIFERIFKKEFPTTTFNWLVYKNKNIMHLGGYNSDLNLGFEYNGEQHYKFIPRWHKTIRDFEERKKRDIIKLKLCEEYRVVLIIVPYWISYQKMEDYIRKKCIEKGIIVAEQKKKINVNKLERIIRLQIYNAKSNHK